MDVLHLNLDYLRPPKAAFEIVHKGDYMLQIEGKKHTRRIFYDVFYTTHEAEKLRDFRELIDSVSITLPKNWTSEETMKFLYSGKFEIKKALANLQAHLEWRATVPKEVPTPATQEILKTGVLYISGRDKEYRPIIIINIDRIKQNKINAENFIEALSFVLSVAREYYFLPGRIENWVIIIETNGLGLLDFPFKILKKIIEFTSINFPCTVEKIYIMNPSKLLKGSWSVIQGAIDPVTRNKIIFLKKTKYSELQQNINANQLEKRYGGSLAEPEKYW